MATLQELLDRTRLELSDLRVPFYERFTGSGDGTRFDLKGIQHIENLVLYEVGVGTPLVEGTDFFLREREGIIIFPTPPAIGTRYAAEGEYSRYFNDAEITTFVQSAFGMHTRNRNPGLNYSSLPAHEVLLVALLAKIEALWVLKTSSAYDINVHAPEGMFIPRGQRFEQLNMLVQEMEARYKELSAALGVGLYAVEMFNLRRVSRRTGRYVPIYLDREFDDTRPPQRVYPEISPMGAEVASSTVMQHPIQVYQGRSWEEEFVVETDGTVEQLTPASEFTAKLLFSPYATHSYRGVLPSFTVVVDTDENVVRVSLTGEDTAKLQSTGTFVWELAWVAGEDDTVPLVQGPVLVEPSLPLKSVYVKTTG